MKRKAPKKQLKPCFLGSAFPCFYLLCPTWDGRQCGFRLCCVGPGVGLDDLCGSLPFRVCQQCRAGCSPLLGAGWAPVPPSSENQSHCYSFSAALLSFLPSILMSVIFCVRENSTVTMISFWSTLDHSECGGLQHILDLLNHRNLNKLSFKIFFPFASSSPLSISVIMRYEFRHPTSYLYKHEHSAGAWWALTDSPSLICASNNTLWL